MSKKERCNCADKPSPFHPCWNCSVDQRLCVLQTEAGRRWSPSSCKLCLSLSRDIHSGSRQEKEKAMENISVFKTSLKAFMYRVSQPPFT